MLGATWGIFWGRLGDLREPKRNVKVSIRSHSGFERIAATCYRSDHSTLFPDVGYRAMFGDGQHQCITKQSGSGATEHDGCGATEHAAEEVDVHGSKVPIIEVAFKSGHWWSIPQDMSAQLYAKHMQGEDGGYTWDWGEDGRAGSWRPEGFDTSINRYRIDFVSRIQTNIDNGRKRSIRIVWVHPQDLVPQFTGQLPKRGRDAMVPQ